MKTFITLSRRAIDSLGCEHKRCRRDEFNSHWYDYMYGLAGKWRFANEVHYSEPHIFQ